MSEFYDLLDELLGTQDDVSDIRVMIRRCWYYDFDGYPIRVWHGQGKLFTSDGNEWLGTIDANGRDIHDTPAITDGRDGSSASYNFKLKIASTSSDIYEALKTEQWRVKNRNIYGYFVLFLDGEGVRPSTPISFFKELVMRQVLFSEKVSVGTDGVVTKNYEATVTAKDGNFGRTSIPGGTYADTIQKARAKQLGVTLDRGSEFLARLANRTYQLP